MSYEQQVINIMFNSTKLFKDTYLGLLPIDLLKQFDLLDQLYSIYSPRYSLAEGKIHSFMSHYEFGKKYYCFYLQDMLKEAPDVRCWCKIGKVGLYEIDYFLCSFYKTVAKEIKFHDKEVSDIEVISFTTEALDLAYIITPIIVQILIWGKSRFFTWRMRSSLHAYFKYCKQTEALAKVKEFYPENEQVELFS